MKQTISNLEQQIARLDATIERAQDLGFKISGLQYLRYRKQKELEFLMQQVQGAGT